MTDIVTWIDRYVDDLIARGHIRSNRVEQAFRRVPRHRCIEGYHTGGGGFVEIPQGDDAVIPDETLRYIYSDSAPVTRLTGNRPVSSSTQAAQMAEVLEALQLQGGETILEVGAGTGYNAALLAEASGGHVVTIDHDDDIADQTRRSLRRLGQRRVTVLTRDGCQGDASRAPYDRIVVTVGSPGIAEPWLDQLALDGFAVAPIAVAGAHPVIRVERGVPWTANGRGICWTDYMTGAGGLAHHDDRSFTSLTDWGPFTLDAPRLARPFTPPLDRNAYEGLTAFVTFSDRRAGPRHIESLDPDEGTCVLRDQSGATAAIQRTGVVVDGHDDELAGQVLDLVDEWMSLDRPAFTAWRCELALQDCPTGRFWRPQRWTIADNDSCPPWRSWESTAP